jgi:hypothetical protein
MPGGNACLLDSNILLRLSKSDDPRMPRSAMRFARWSATGMALLHPQTLGECGAENFAFI